MVAAVAIADPAAALVPIIAPATRLELRAQRCTGGRADDTAGNGAAGPAGRRPADDGAGGAAQEGTAQRTVLRRGLRHRHGCDQPERGGRCNDLELHDYSSVSPRPGTLRQAAPHIKL